MLLLRVFTPFDLGWHFYDHPWIFDPAVWIPGTYEYPSHRWEPSLLLRTSSMKDRHGKCLFVFNKLLLQPPLCIFLWITSPLLRFNRQPSFARCTKPAFLLHPLTTSHRILTMTSIFRILVSHCNLNTRGTFWYCYSTRGRAGAATPVPHQVSGTSDTNARWCSVRWQGNYSSFHSPCTHPTF